MDVLRPAAEHAQRAFPGQPAVRAAVLSTLGRTYYDLGLWAEAEAASRAALAIRDSLYGDEPHADRIQSIEEIARLDFRAGRRSAVRGYRLALRLRAERYGPRSREAIRGWIAYGDILEESGDSDGARRAVRRALALARSAFGPQSLEAAYALDELAFLQLQYDEVAEADSALATLVALARGYYAPDAPELATVLQHQSIARLFLGDIDAAERLNAEALRIREARFDAGHPDLNETRGIRAAVLVERGRFAEAEAIMRRAAEAFDAGLVHPDPFQQHLARAEWGAALAGLGRTAEAERLLRPSVAWLRERLGDRHNWTRHQARHLADLYDVTGRLDDARPYRALADAPVASSR